CPDATASCGKVVRPIGRRHLNRENSRDRNWFTRFTSLSPPRISRLGAGGGEEENRQGRARRSGSIKARSDNAKCWRQGRAGHQVSRQELMMRDCQESRWPCQTRLAGLCVGAFWEPGDPALISLPGPAWHSAP